MKCVQIAGRFQQLVKDTRAITASTSTTASSYIVARRLLLEFSLRACEDRRIWSKASV